uniref:Uncharacterized protein n=1 Tax=Lygus hesperus TaxID=30085 RepID=A0A0A9WQ71_LYGHE
MVSGKTASKRYHDDDEEREIENVVHNRRSSVKQYTATKQKGNSQNDGEVRSLTVLPSDAHRQDGHDSEFVDGYNEEYEMAVAAERDLRKRTNEDDFTIASIPASISATSTALSKSKLGSLAYA